MWAHSQLLWVQDTVHSQLMWAENCDVLGQDDLRYRAVTAIGNDPRADLELCHSLPTAQNNAKSRFGYYRKIMYRVTVAMRQHFTDRWPSTPVPYSHLLNS